MHLVDVQEAAALAASAAAAAAAGGGMGPPRTPGRRTPGRRRSSMGGAISGMRYFFLLRLPPVAHGVSPRCRAFFNLGGETVGFDIICNDIETAVN